jgi:hypothetical protein
MFDPMYADPAPTGEESRRVTPIAPEPFSWWDYYLRSPVYEERALCGMYDELADTLTKMGGKALGNLDCPEDFNRYQATPTSNVEFKDSDGYELRTMIVGEIAGSAHGTVLRAIGNYYIAADVSATSVLMIFAYGVSLSLSPSSSSPLTIPTAASRIFWRL